MRNIYFFLVLVTMLFASPLYALDFESTYTLSTGVMGGILWGKGIETVYAGNNYINSSPFQSELRWDLKPLVYTGLFLDYSLTNPFLGNGLSVSLQIKYGLPLKTGVMENRDWLAYNQNYLTHYSEHDAYSGNSSFMTVFSFGYSFALFENLHIKPFAELSYMRFDWQGKDGFRQYGNDAPEIRYEPTLPSTPKIPSYGTIITYSQNWIIFTPGIEAGIKLNDYFGILLNAGLSPILYGFHKDNHVLRDTIFLDYMFGGLFVKGSLSIEYLINNRFALYLSASYMNVSRTRGDTYISRWGMPHTFHPGISGGGFSLSDYSLRLRYIF